MAEITDESFSSFNNGEFNACMYLCMYVCMYVCMYMADVIRFNMNMLGSVTVSDLDAFIGQLRNVVYLCMFMYVYLCMYICMYVCMQFIYVHWV